MLETIRFQKSVPSDLENIFRGYESVSVNSANKLREEICRTLDLISTFPEMYAVVDNETGIRLVKTRNYPILIQYKVFDGLPTVLSIYHSDLDESKRMGGNAG